MPVGSERDSDHSGAVGLRCGAGCGSVAAMETTHRRPRPQGVRPLPERAGAETLGQGESPATPSEKPNLFFIRQPVRRCAANVGICLGDFAAGTFLTTNSVKQGNSGKHGREETMGEREKKSYGKAKKNEHVDFCKNQVSSPTPSVYQQ